MNFMNEYKALDEESLKNKTVEFKRAITKW